MGGIRLANKTHYKGWTAKLQRVWSKDDDKDGFITIIEDLMVPDKFTVHVRGKQYAKVEPPADMDGAIHVAELGYMAWGLDPKGTSKEIGKEVEEHLKALLGTELKEVVKEKTPVSIRGDSEADVEDRVWRSQCQKKE